MANLDSIDRQILAALQAKNTLTADELAQTIARSPSVIARRLRKLRRDGIIQHEGAAIDPRSLGYSTWTVVHVYLERHDVAGAKRLREQLTASDRVQMILDIAGDVDLMLLVVSKDLEQYDTFADEFLESSSAVRLFKSHFVKKRHKASLALPIKS